MVDGQVAVGLGKLITPNLSGLVYLDQDLTAARHKKTVGCNMSIYRISYMRGLTGLLLGLSVRAHNYGLNYDLYNPNTNLTESASRTVTNLSIGAPVGIRAMFIKSFGLDAMLAIWHRFTDAILHTSL
jgi:hypothetical protein